MDSESKRLARYVARFDAGEYWLAHEELEELWLADRQDFYKGLIHLAAGCLHQQRGNERGARTKFASAARYLAAQPPGVLDNVDVEALRATAADLHECVGCRPLPTISMQQLLGVIPVALEEARLPYRVTRHDDGYQTGRDPGRRD